ncbi:uncharacterized protein LOC141907431 [Tubulanus polymorphus]|uniref:uncharacterized protein LOC141907431 n=1 Tax=Tubulanus polymorphus TaxID=672921 RepID=UPI003DA3DA14
MEYRNQPECSSKTPESEEEPETMDIETQESTGMEDETQMIDEQTLQKHLDYHQEIAKMLSDVIRNKQLPRIPPLPQLPTTHLELLLGLKESKTKTKKMSGTHLELLLGLKESKTKKTSGDELNEFLKSKLIIETEHLSFPEIQSEEVISFAEITDILKTSHKTISNRKAEHLWDHIIFGGYSNIGFAMSDKGFLGGLG